MVDAKTRFSVQPATPSIAGCAEVHQPHPAAALALAAENLFLRKQLALYLERKVKPRRVSDASRLTLVWLSGFPAFLRGDGLWLSSSRTPWGHSIPPRPVGREFLNHAAMGV